MVTTSPMVMSEEELETNDCVVCGVAVVSVLSASVKGCVNGWGVEGEVGTSASLVNTSSINMRVLT